MNDTLRVAAIQMVSGPSKDSNIAAAEQLLGQASKEGAQLAVLPENWAFMGKHERDKLDHGETYGHGPLQEFMSKKASQHGIWIMGGAIPLQSGHDHVFNSCLLYDPKGECIARYDKMHLFDVCVDKHQNEVYRESNTIAAGNEIVVAETPFCNIGLSICYDLRFPELYRKMLKRDINIITVPSAFTETTGKKHWEPLLRARAIENLCYVIAPNQGGENTKGRVTWGHSMIINPWGDILASMEMGTGVIIADIDLQQLRDLRASFPSLQHKRLMP